MTANAFEEDRRNALKAGMNGHLAKPVEVSKLYQTLSEIFAKEPQTC
jgi:CheY-like chemotaxis protein